MPGCIAMAKTVSLRDANQNFSRYVRDVEGGGELIITRRGKPVARLSAVPGGTRVLTPEQEAARKRSRARMKRGFDLGIERFDREEMYRERYERYKG
jgi:antitoxin (DNA-binding transcriptional repressor) of toxin-antitoxin stability system